MGLSAAPAERGGVLRVELVDRDGLLTARERAWLGERLVAVGGLLGERFGAGGEARVALVGDDEMTGLHGRLVGSPETTDVLTFDLRDDAGGPLDADIVACVDEASRCSAEFGHERGRELLLYATHGLLHCLGYDDKSADAARVMHGLEDELLESLGEGRVFAAGDGLGGEP